MSLKKSIKFKDRLVKGISTEGHFKISVVKTTEVVRSARERHNLSLLNTLLLGRTLTASMLLASELKGEERLQLKLEGPGPVGMLIAEANRAGEIRGYSRQPLAELDYTQPGTTLAEGLGAGLLTVSKTLYNEAEPHRSTLQLFESDVTTDIAHYLAQSEQIPSAVMLDVKMGESGEIIHAGGLMIQRLPGASDEVINELQERLNSLEQVPDLLDREIYVDEIMNMVVKPYPVKELGGQPLHFFCRCNRDRFISALSLLSFEDLREMEGESQEMVCHFCNNRFDVTSEEINKLVTRAQAKMN